MCVIAQLVEGAEAKAYYGLAVNYRALEALVDRLLVKETLSGNEVPPACLAWRSFRVCQHQHVCCISTSACRWENKHSISVTAGRNADEHAPCRHVWRRG